MKQLLTAVCATLALMLSPAWAQMAEDPAVLLAKIQADKKGVVEKSLKLTPAEAKKFWPLYDEFQRELAVPQSAYTRAVLDYVAAGTTLTDANAKRLSEQVLSASRDEARLHEKHFKQLLKVLPAHRAARYMQIENKVQAIVRFESAKAIPLVN